MPKTITDIIPPSRRRATLEQAPPEAFGPQGPQMPPPPPPRHEPEARRRFPWGYVIAAVVVILAAVGILFAFGGTKVEVTPVVRAVNVSSSFSATPSAGDLPFEVVTAEVTAEKQVSADGTETVDLPAQGTITIYNAQNRVQELIANTRFETPEGLIFRIRESVRVPAGTTGNPGELSVTVYADATGGGYNIGPSTFTLPGLRGSAAFEAVYAKSERSMTGGFSGTRPAVPQATRTAEYEAMRVQLETDARAAIADKVSSDYVLFPNAVAISFTEEPDGESTGTSATLRQKAAATAFIFPREPLARAIAYATLGVYAGQPVTVRDISGLALAPEEGVSAGAQVVAFTLSGTADITWLIDAEELKAALAGKTRDAARTLLNGFSELESARLILKPFWKGSLPSDPADIEVVIKEPKR